jgi:hypothetical protein
VNDDAVESSQREFTSENCVRGSLGGGELLGDGMGAARERFALDAI